jgi:glucokinase
VDIIAFATAGAVNLQNTKVESSTPNLPKGYNEIDFSTLSNKPVYVDNDANAAAWAEYKLGAAKGHKNTIIVTLGTGIGGGIIVNGSILRGKSGRAAEVGSIKLFPDKRRKCNCGNYDCWEAYASGSGLKTTAYESAKTFKVFQNSLLKDKEPEQITTHDIIKGVKQEDAFCIRVFNLWQEHLLSGLISLANIFDPESIVISGGMGEFIQFEKLESQINSSIVVSEIKLLCAQTKNNAGMIGAALLACEKYN